MSDKYTTGRCAVCNGVTEAEYDGETGSWYPATYCGRACSNARSLQPYCHNGDCPRQICGTHTVISNGRAVGRGARPVYECPRCGLSGTAVHWAVLSGYHTATVDAAENQYLIPARTRSATDRVSRSHPVSRAYGRAYLLGLRHTEVSIPAQGMVF
jgi:hypothetical protein